MASETRGTGLFFGMVAVIGAIIGLWAFTTLITGLSSVDWQVSQMLRRFLVATGNIHEYETLVDYYTHIKGIEYLVAVIFFVAFPIYYKSLKPKEPTASDA